MRSWYYLPQRRAHRRAARRRPLAAAHARRPRLLPAPRLCLQALSHSGKYAPVDEESGKAVGRAGLWAANLKASGGTVSAANAAARAARPPGARRRCGQLTFWVLCVIASRLLGGMVVPAFHYAFGDMSPYYLFAGWIYDLPYSCAAKRWTFAGFFRIAIDVLQVTGRHRHHHHLTIISSISPSPIPPPPSHLLQSLHHCSSHSSTSSTSSRRSSPRSARTRSSTPPRRGRLRRRSGPPPRRRPRATRRAPRCSTASASSPATPPTRPSAALRRRRCGRRWRFSRGASRR